MLTYPPDKTLAPQLPLATAWVISLVMWTICLSNASIYGRWQFTNVNSIFLSQQKVIASYKNVYL